MKKLSLNEWIIYGEMGSSSKTMWGVLTGAIKPGNRLGRNAEIPYDPDDFSRCYKLVTLCQVTKDQLQQIKTVLPFYAPFIDNWDKLCLMYETRNPNMYKFMEPLVDEARIIAGWVRTSPNSWKFEGGTSTTLK
jgi:hypothetical protein